MEAVLAALPAGIRTGSIPETPQGTVLSNHKFNLFDDLEVLPPI
jgi:hypothetical protein